jgi:hypothetical protein
VKNVRNQWRATFFWEEASLLRIFSLFQLDLMNLFKLNAQLAVKLGQSLETLYNLEYLEYSLLLNIINEEIEENNNRIESESKKSDVGSSVPFKVNLPSHLKLK